VNTTAGTQTLPVEFARDCFHCKQIWREGGVCVYECCPFDAPDRVRYEVICVRRDADGEHYPESQEWGTGAWSAVNRLVAIGTARSIVDVPERDRPFVARRTMAQLYDELLHLNCNCKQL
jgi:hypothetical protein